MSPFEIATTLEIEDLDYNTERPYGQIYAYFKRECDRDAFIDLCESYGNGIIPTPVTQRSMGIVYATWEGFSS